MTRRAARWIFAVEDARRLASVRIGLCSVLALRLATTNYRAVAGLAAVQPVFYLRFLERIPSSHVLVALQVVGVAAAALAAAGLASTASLGVALACALFLDGSLNSVGRFIVGDAALTLCLIVLLASCGAAAEAWTLRAQARQWAARSSWPGARDRSAAPTEARHGSRYGWPVRTGMITVSLAYFFAGFEKLRYSGAAWVTGGNLRWVLYANSDRRAHPDALALFIADRPPLAHLAAAGTVLLEVGFPLVLFVPKLRWLFIAALAALHVAVYAALGLDYSTQWLTVFVLFVDWPAVVARKYHRDRPIGARGAVLRT